MKYIVVKGTDLNDFERNVNSKIVEGYEPVGGISSEYIRGNENSQIYHKSYTNYTQAMVSNPFIIRCHCDGCKAKRNEI